MRVKNLLAPVLLAVIGVGLLIQLPLAVAQRAGDYDFFDTLIDVRHILRDAYADPTKIDDARMRAASIDAMLETIGDPHTVFVPPSARADFDKDLRGTYVGIGCEVNIVDRYLTIISPMDGSPALEAGVMAGDVVLEIEGQSTFDKPVDACIEMLMGAPGTPVRIKVRHLDGEEEDITIVRNRINTRTVRGLFRIGQQWSYCIDGSGPPLGLAYIRLTQFNQDTDEDLRAALESINTGGAGGLNGLILDLRDNPGGSLETAVQVSDLFLEGGTIVSVRPKPGKGVEEIASARREGTLPHFPMIVLVNGQSASASEIVAGALQQNGRAKILGTRTYGKGSVQDVRELDYNRGTLKFTTAMYYLPNGRSINRLADSVVWGVDPDPGMVVGVNDEDYIAMLRARREFEIIREVNPGLPQCGDGAWVRENLKDEQLALAVESLRARVTGGEWPMVGEDNAAAVAFDVELQRAMEARRRMLEQLNSVEQRISQLHGLQEQAGKPPLLPSDVDFRGGVIVVQDRLGNTIGSYRIEGGNLEVALEALQLTPLQ